MKKVLGLLFLFATVLVAQNNVYQYRILQPIGGATATGNTGFRNTGGLTASFASISWATFGTLTSCTVQVDFSNDGTTVAGQLITAQTCTSSGSIIAGSSTSPAFVRVSYVIGTGGGYINFTALGCNNSTCTGGGGGGGGVTSVSAGAGLQATTNPITATGTISLLLTCSTNQVLQWNGTTWACTTLAGSGTVTSVTIAGTASQITASGTCTITTTGTCTLSLPSGVTLTAPNLGTPASGVMTNVTGLPLTTGVTGVLPIANGGTNNTTFTTYFPSSYTGTAEVSSSYLIDASAAYTSGDPCAAIHTAIAAATSQGADLWLGGFAGKFTNGIVPCQSNPFENSQFSGRIVWGPVDFITSVPWVTPSNPYRFVIEGTGTADVGTVTDFNGTLQACTAEATGWNGTNCVIGGITVAGWGASGHSVVFTYPHGPFGAGTYFPLLWIGGMGNAGINLGNAFGTQVKNLVLWAGGPGGADFSLYSTGEQESSGLFYVAHRACNRACEFYDRAQGTGSGPSHFVVEGGEFRMDVGQVAAVGYPNVATPKGMGWGIVYEGNRDVVFATGGTCTTFPQAYPSTFSAGGITGYTFTYAGSCSNVTGLTCNVGSNVGSSATCTWTTVGNTVTGITAGTAGTGYSLADTLAGGGFEIGNFTINGTPSVSMQTAIMEEGEYNSHIGSVHCEWLVADCVRMGNGNGPVQVSFIHNVDLANAGTAAVHLGVGIDNNQTIVSVKGGSTAPIVDDQNGITLNAAIWVGGVEKYLAGGENIANGITLGALQDAGIQRTAAKTICIGSATGTATNTNIDCSGKLQVSTIVDANGNPFIISSATGSAVDSITVTNAATANPATVSIGATGSDANINLNLVSKGTGTVECNGSPCGGGSGTVSSGTIDGLAYYTAATTVGSITPPTTNGSYICGYSVTTGVAVVPTCNLSGVVVNTPATPYTMVYSDRATYQRLTGGSTFTINLPQVTGNTASNMPFVTQNGNSGLLTLTANAADKIDNSATGGSSTVLSNFASFVYQDSTGAPGNWWTIKIPTFAAFGSTCASALTWSTTTGFTCTTAIPENDISGATAAATITETGATFSITRAGVATANLTFPWVIQNTNSTNNNTSGVLGLSGVGTSTGQTVLNLNNAATGSDFVDWGTGGTFTAGVLSGQTALGGIKINGAGYFGVATTAGCQTFGTAGGLCAAEGTSATNVSGYSNIYPDSTQHEWLGATNGTTIYGILNRSVPTSANETGKVATDSAKAICTAAAGGCNVTGQYGVFLNVWGSGTACSSVTAGSVVFTITWVDEQGTTHTNVPMAPFYDYKSAAVNATGTFNFNTALTTEGANVNMVISTNGSAAPTVTGTYTACTTGTGTYNFRATMTRLQ